MSDAPCTSAAPACIPESLTEYWSHKPRVLGVYEGHYPTCPPRLRVNVYKGCAFQCNYCYVWRSPGCQVPHPFRGIAKRLRTEIRLAKGLGVPDLTVMLSCSCDPFQPCEAEHKHTAEVLAILADEGYPILLMTQNPGMALRQPYLDVLRRARCVVEVTVPSTRSGPGAAGIFHSMAPPAEDRIKAMRALTEQGITVRLRLDPIIPPIPGPASGQSEDDIQEVLRWALDAGARMVITKCMRLTGDVHPLFHEQLRAFYFANGHTRLGGRGDDFDLYPWVQERLLRPVVAACSAAGLPLCICSDAVRFPGTVSCDNLCPGASGTEKP